MRMLKHFCEDGQEGQFDWNRAAQGNWTMACARCHRDFSEHKPVEEVSPQEEAERARAVERARVVYKWASDFYLNGRCDDAFKSLRKAFGLDVAEWLEEVLSRNPGDEDYPFSVFLSTRQMSDTTEYAGPSPSVGDIALYVFPELAPDQNREHVFRLDELVDRSLREIDDLAGSDEEYRERVEELASRFDAVAARCRVDRKTGRRERFASALEDAGIELGRQEK